MNIKNNNIKEKIKNIIKGTDSYRKEQRVFAIVLLCFIMSGAGLPAIRDNFSEIMQDSGIAIEQSDNTSCPSVIKEDKKDTDKNNKNKSKEDSTEKNKNENVKDNSDKDNSSKTEYKTENNNKSKPESSQSKSNSKPENKSNNASEPAGSSSNNSGSSGVSEKKWVPPVYKTVHHDAVYETQRVVICNYCGATFSSTGEFQVHKDANGG